MPVSSVKGFHAVVSSPHYREKHQPAPGLGVPRVSKYEWAWDWGFGFVQLGSDGLRAQDTILPLGSQEWVAQFLRTILNPGGDSPWAVQPPVSCYRVSRQPPELVHTLTQLGFILDSTLGSVQHT